jgi:hypothetical protein
MPFDAKAMPFDAIARQLIQAITGDLRGSRCGCFRLKFNVIFDVRRSLPPLNGCANQKNALNVCFNFQLSFLLKTP